MKVSELRIGNIVFSKISGGLITVQYIPIDIDMDNYGAVKLTEEWLIKFGFQRHDEGSVSAQFSYGTNPVTQDYLIYLKWIKDYENNHQLKGFPFYQNGHFEIKTVHQLQNLVNALCGKELELKEPFGKSE